MIFTDDKLSALRECVAKRLSKKRFNHTLRVEAAAVRIAEFCLPESISELRAAAILHDLTKELDDKEQFLIMKLQLMLSTSIRCETLPEMIRL